MNPTIEIYTRPGCHLCDDAKKVIQEAASHFTFQLSERNVEENPQWESDFGSEVPVVFINGRKVFKHKISRVSLARHLARLK